ncbi:IS607 family transposase [Candidatus Uabimicrobium amorphum]|uniref:Resolvase n=1 Tax=Uabimicrobium amorphum TaxID=2596890 RepID=A0A5S9ITW1_UABAM|nr:IS607 family transposase [Candidatus Uabimicrobium amorphum]BBM88043.1 resolvase [Candidatus Uabimicrobium amorphum]
MKISIKKAAKELGVSAKTLRRWEEKGKISSERTKGGHRRYDIRELRKAKMLGVQSVEEVTLAYARVSSHDQKQDLVRQAKLLESYCSSQGWKYEVLKDMGSGLNYRKRGLKTLIKKICQGEINRLVLTHKDRLLRFGSEIVFSLCEQFAVEVVIINSSEEVTFEEELVTDVLEIITVFSARLYGARSHKNRKVMKQLRQVAEEIEKE